MLGWRQADGRNVDRPAVHLRSWRVEPAVRVAPGSASGDKCDDGVDLVPGA
jgi:hypothetical protein